MPKYQAQLCWWLPSIVYEDIEADTPELAVVEATRRINDGNVSYDGSKVIWDASTSVQLVELLDEDEVDQLPEAHLNKVERHLIQEITYLRPLPAIEKGLLAMQARIKGVWDDPHLQEFGPLRSLEEDLLRMIEKLLGVTSS